MRLLLVFVLLATVVGGVVDLVLDAPDSLLSAHVVYEVALIFIAMATTVLLWRGWWGTRRCSCRRNTASSGIGPNATHGARARSPTLVGLGRAIEERFEAWNLTPVEREIALLLLKGRSHKEIAFTTGRSDRAVRQHAVSVYQTSNLRGRAELAAFFLEDLQHPK